MNNLIHLIYRSSATKWLTEEDLVSLLERARKRNKDKSITGMLLYANACFIQVLEGEEIDVEEVYSRILKDPLNNANVILLKENINTRDFPEWSMGFANLDAYSGNDLQGYVDMFKSNFAAAGAADTISRAKKYYCILLKTVKSGAHHIYKCFCYRVIECRPVASYPECSENSKTSDFYMI